ncbi:MAG TPA: cyclase family protein [Phaeodactylibacter sp.]|nr:cyclase family protein [Phaeodactylibacter sp.]
MPYIDLTQPFNQSISLYPGSKPPVIKSTHRVATDGCAVKHFSFNSHQGTHIDAVAHMKEGGKTLDELPIEYFLGKAITIDISEYATRLVPKTAFDQHIENLQLADFALLYTSWGKKWGTLNYADDFPILSPEAMHFLCQQNIKAIGLDCFSPDPVTSIDFENHHIAFSYEVLFVENLCNLELLPTDQLINFQCLPMKIEDADGAPVRAMGHW